MAYLEVRLLGAFELIAPSGAPVALPTKKARALLAVLALDPGRPWSRDKLAALLWEYSGGEQARASLRQTLSVIRKAMPNECDALLVSEGDTLAVEPAAVDVDVVRFEQLAAKGTANDLESAAALCRGDCLDGFGLREESFEEWLRAERHRLRDRALDVLSRLLTLYLETDAHDAGVRAANRLLAIDPLREDIHRALMELYARLGHTDSALRQFTTCRETLERDLGVQPAPETRALYDSVLDRRMGSDAASDSSVAGRSSGIGPTHVNLRASIPKADAGPDESRAVEMRSTDNPVLPDRPSVAVLPFDNMSDDAGQTYFSDGITEDIITELSRNRALFVISRKSSFAYRGRDIPMQQIGRELGVRYVVEGSVRRSGERVRITVQLVDAESGEHVWAERYDRDLGDVFEVQDEVTRTIVSTLVGRLDAAAEALSRAKQTDDLEAYDLMLRGMHQLQYYSHEEYVKARELFERAVKRDPGFARAYGLLALTRIYEWFWVMDGPGREEAIETGRKALHLDDHESRAHLALCVAYMFSGRLDDAEYHIDRTVGLNPNDDLALVEQGRLLMYLGHPDQGAMRVREALRLNPYHPNWYWNILGRNLHSSGRYEEAVGVFRRITTPPFWVHAYLAACHHMLGATAEVEKHRREALALWPDFSLRNWAENFPYRNVSDREQLFETFRLAGFPD